MKKTLTHAQMLDLWRMAAGLEPPLAEASVERFDSLEVDRSLAIIMRQWYLQLLDTAELCYLAPENIAARIEWQKSPSSQRLLARLPADVRRVVSVSKDKASPNAKLFDEYDLFSNYSSPSGLTRRYSSPLGNSLPRADAPQPSDGEISHAFSAGGIIVLPGPEIPEIVMAVCDPGDEMYILDESAVSLIKFPSCYYGNQP